ncbi:MAG: amidohydrolase [Cyclobacteriaceae bacterium]
MNPTPVTSVPRKISLTFPLFLSLLLFLSSCTPKPNASIIVLNARIWTGVPGAPFVQALAVAGDTILATGTTNEIRKFAGNDSKVIDAGGKLIIPGFNDAHIHFLGGSMGLTQVELSATRSAAEVDAFTNKFINENPDAEWITGRGWQYTFYPGGLPDHQSMSGIKTDKPLFIRAYDGHSGYANRAALRLAGISKGFRFTGFGEVVFDKYGEPTGLLKESAMGLVSGRIPPSTREQKLNALRKGLKYIASMGITSAQNASGSVEDVALFSELLQKGELTVRYTAAFSADESTDQQLVSELAAARDSIGTKNNMLRADAIKFAIDGVIESHTGAMIGKYNDLTETDPLVVGQLSMDVTGYRNAVALFDKAGFRIYTHAIGDRGVREALNAYEHAASVNGERDARHRVEHIETISPQDLPRFKQLGVMASMEPIHADPATIAVWEKAIGNARLGYSFAWNSMLQNEAALVFSSDWPAAISVNPIRGIHVAVNRRTPEGYPENGWVPEQKITIEQALRAYTYMGAYSSFEEKIKGTLEKGKLADFIILSQDLFSIDPMKIHETKVLYTVLGGKIIYEIQQ